jgi:hypothetical protein
MSIEAMKQALEIIKNMRSGYGDDYHTGKEWTAMDALRQAIEQAEKQEKLCNYCGGIGRVVCNGRCMSEQEPVAWVDKVWVERLDISKQLRMELLFSRCQLNNNQIPLYTAPPKREWVGLTDEEIVACGWCDLRFARAIEAKLKERNT